MIDILPPMGLWVGDVLGIGEYVDFVNRNKMK